MNQVAVIERIQATTVLKPVLDRQTSETQASRPEPASAGEPPPAPGGELPSIAGRDFASALDLIREASEAVRISEDRANDLEHQLAQMTARANEQVRALEAQLLATERRMQRAEERARGAEARADNAETWLIRLHDAITSSFKPAGSEPGA